MDTDTLPALADADDPMVRLAVAAHLARDKGQSRAHTASDLNAYLRWGHRLLIHAFHGGGSSVTQVAGLTRMVRTLTFVAQIE